MDDNMRADLCAATIENAHKAFQKAISADMLDQVISRNERSQNALSAGVSFLGTLAAGDYGSRIHMESFRVMPEKEILVYMMEMAILAVWANEFSALR